jgi:hypothetical protein
MRLQSILVIRPLGDPFLRQPEQLRTSAPGVFSYLILPRLDSPPRSRQ